MAFLAPWFLAGLALLAVPVLVHLTRRERVQPVEFPSLMFVRKLPQPTTRRRRLRDLPLLALRVLALALLAAAFARPLLERSRAAGGAAADGRDVVILLDRSASMSAPGRWARAQEAARRAVAALAPADRATLVAFDANAQTVVPRTGDAEALRAAIDSMRPGAGTGRYAPALAAAGRVLEGAPSPRREVLLVSDFQRAGWREEPEARLPAGARLAWVDVGGAVPNVSIAGVELRREREPGAASAIERVRPLARVVASGGPDGTANAEPRTVPVTLEVNGRVAQTVTARVAPGEPAAAAFAAIPLAGGWTRAVVRVPGDAFPLDDAWHLALSRGQALRVLLVDGPARRDDAGLYLRRALAVGDDPPMEVDVVASSRLGASTLAGHALVVLHDAPLRGEAARLVARYVQEGGGLLVAAGEASAPEAWDPALAALLPARPGAVVEAPGEGARLASIERNHPALAPFATPRSGDLGAARVLRRRALAPAPDASVLARFDDGAPALLERPAGRGRVLLWASTLNGWWTDLALQPVFVPLVHGLAVHAAAFVPAPPSRTVGETYAPGAEARVPNGSGSAAWVVEAPGGARTRLGRPGPKAEAPTVARLDVPGFHLVRAADAGDLGTPVAVNVDPAESDPERVDPATIARAVAPAPDGPTAAVVTPPESPAEREARQRWWWWLLAAMLALLGIEPLLAARRGTLARGAATLPTPTPDRAR